MTILFACMSMYQVCPSAGCQQGAEEALDYLELGFQMLINSLVGTKNCTQVLWTNSHGS